MEIYVAPRRRHAAEPNRASTQAQQAKCRTQFVRQSQVTNR